MVIIEGFLIGVGLILAGLAFSLLRVALGLVWALIVWIGPRYIIVGVFIGGVWLLGPKGLDVFPHCDTPGGLACHHTPTPPIVEQVHGPVSPA